MCEGVFPSLLLTLEQNEHWAESQIWTLASFLISDVLLSKSEPFWVCYLICKKKKRRIIMGQLLLRKNSAESVTNKGPSVNNIHKDKDDDDDDK